MTYRLNRRDFVKTGIAGLAGAAYGERATASSTHSGGRGLTLENDQMVWEFSESGRKIASQGLRNKVSGHYFPLRAARELQLILSATKERIEIPWWSCSFGLDNDATPEAEKGYKEGFAREEFDDSKWQTCLNLGLRDVGSSAGLTLNQNRPPVVHQGYGWFRTKVELPSDARGKEIVLSLGGYDETDWQEYWVYVNGADAGRRSTTGRWRSPGKFTISPESPAYATLHFGSGSANVVAVRTRSYDRRYGGLSDDVLDRHMFDPVLHDQFVTVGEPYLAVDDFEVVGMNHEGKGAKPSLSVKLASPSSKIQVELHYELDGAIRRKWADIQNASADPVLLLDVNLDTFQVDASLADGGYGYPLTIDDQVFAAVEHPSGFNRWHENTVQMTHFPGRWLKPGESWRSHSAIVGVGPEHQANRQFLDYIETNGVRKNKILALYDPFGITAFTDGMSWALNDDQNAGTLDLLGKWQKQGIKFDYYIPDMSLDTTADLKQFRLFSFPDGPGEMIQQIRNLDMKFGQWFCVTAGSWSNGRNPKMAPSGVPKPKQSPYPTFRNGFLDGWGGVSSLCVASEPYFSTLRDAVLYHIKENHVELIKFDVGDYYCNSTQHGHLPGKYSTEASFSRLLAIARAARAANPNVFTHWYWGIYSPFIALDGDVIFDIRISMEAASTGDYPALFFRDAVTQALDQASQYARWVPPRSHDSLGVWLANNWWGNQMETVRWQEALVMDLARGNLLFPQVWGDLNNFEDHDVDFLARMQQLVKKNEPIFLTPRHTIGDAWQDEIYGYSYFDGNRGFVFLNNVSFDSRPVKLMLGEAIGLRGGQGQQLELRMHHPRQVSLTKNGGRSFVAGQEVEIQLLPFEVAMIEVGPSGVGESGLPVRDLIESSVRYSYAPALREISGPEDLEMHFADAGMLEGRGYSKSYKAFEAALPAYPEGRHHVAVVCTFSRDGRKWHQSQINELVQAIAKVDGAVVEFTATPDYRQISNNQWSSWIVFSAPLPTSFAGRTIQFGVSTYLPEGVAMTTKLSVIKEWWKPRRRSLPNYWV